VHHADKHVTAATGLLHHPLEMVFNFIVTVCLLILFGISLQVIVAYSLLSTLHNLLVHANVSIPARLDRVLRWFMVTPDMHRTHHSVRPTEGNSNFGQLFPYWDWLFRTYQAKPSTPLAKLKMGLIEPNKGFAFNPLGLLSQPFVQFGAANRRNTK
jgi:sterol desaturase/sphingolipid hydroxylase (fatty acid hydroxylase superfamily)